MFAANRCFSRSTGNEKRQKKKDKSRKPLRGLIVLRFECCVLRFGLLFGFITENCGMIIGKAFGPAFLERLAVSKGSAFGRPSQRAKSLSGHQSAGKVLGKPSPGVFLSAKHTIPQLSVKREIKSINEKIRKPLNQFGMRNAKFREPQRGLIIRMKRSDRSVGDGVLDVPSCHLLLFPVTLRR